MDVTTAPMPDTLSSSPSQYRLQNLTLQKAERATVLAPNAREAARQKYVPEKVKPARNVETSGQNLPASASLKLSKGATNYQSHGRHRGWVNGNGR